MKKLLSLFLIFTLCLFAGCQTKDQNQDEQQNVVINLPTDNSVNGYKENPPLTQENTPQNISYCGNKNSKVFHLTTCSSVKNMKAENRVEFPNRDEAINSGFHPCSRCNP